MAHRYLYYVECTPVLSDYDYDVLERKAMEVLPSISPVHQPGSDSPKSYSDEVIRRAHKLRYPWREQ
ncbi:MAG: hypothetical protein NVV63_12650 [Opitutus sp.]|nr:hypothetical protein [Opitutus sp.]